MEDQEYERRLAREAEYLRHLKDRLRAAAPHQRQELLELILITEHKILTIMRDHRQRQERETANMEVALTILRGRQRQP